MESEMESEMTQQQRFEKIEGERVSRVPGEAWQLLDGEDSLQRLVLGGHEKDSLAAVESAQTQLGQEEETWIPKTGERARLRVGLKLKGCGHGTTRKTRRTSQNKLTPTTR